MSANGGVDEKRASGEPRAQWGKVGALVTGQGVSLAGDNILLVAIAWTAVKLGGSGAVTALMLCATIPKALMLIFGGAVADALGPRFVLLRTTSGRILLLAAGAVAVFFAESLWTLMAIALVEGILLGLGGPSFGTLVPRLAPGSQLARANSLYSMVLRIAPITGAPIGAWLIATGQLWPALVVVSMTCAVSFSCLWYVTKGIPRPPRTGGVSMLKRSGDGFRLLGANARLRWLFISSFCLDLAFGWPINAALPLLAFKRDWGVQAVGTVIAAFGAGALASAAIGALVAHRLPLLVRLVVSGVGIAVGLALMALMPSVLALAGVSFMVGLASGLNGPATVTLYQQSTPKARMGAAMSTLALAGIGTGPFSIALFGGLALVLGLQATWLICGVVALAAPVTALLALRCPEQVEPEPEPEQVEAPAKQLVGAAAG